MFIVIAIKILSNDFKDSTVDVLKMNCKVKKTQTKRNKD